MESGFPSSGGRGVKQKKNVGKHVVISSSLSNDDTVSGNKEDTGSVAAKVNDIERQMLEGTLVLVGDTRCSTCKVFGHLLDRYPKKTITDVNVKTQREVVRGLHVFPKSHLGYKLVQTTTAKKMDNRLAKQKDTNSNKGIGVAPSNFFNSKSDDVNLGNSKNVNLDNKDNDSDDDVEDEDNETSRFMASKSSKGAGSSKSGCEMGERVYMSVGKMITLMAMMRNAKT
nr:hypothetical protein [Tanacetum cinerariifolium]